MRLTQFNQLCTVHWMIGSPEVSLKIQSVDTMKKRQVHRTEM